MNLENLEWWNDNEIKRVWFEDAITSWKKEKDILLWEELYSLVSYEGKFFLIAKNNSSFPWLEYWFDWVLEQKEEEILRAEIQASIESMNIIESKNKEIPQYILIVNRWFIWYITKAEWVRVMKEAKIKKAA